MFVLSWISGTIYKHAAGKACIFNSARTFFLHTGTSHTHACSRTSMHSSNLDRTFHYILGHHKHTHAAAKAMHSFFNSGWTFLYILGHHTHARMHTFLQTGSDFSFLYFHTHTRTHAPAKAMHSFFHLGSEPFFLSFFTYLIREGKINMRAYTSLWERMEI